MVPETKLKRLREIISGYRSCVVAFSGGLDSTFLLKICATVLPKNKFLAVCAVSETYPAKEISQVRLLAGKIGAPLKIIRTRELNNGNFARNSPKRCYYCKKELFSKLTSIARRKKYNFVAEATTLSDKSDYRPGTLAKKEFKVKSPLVQAGLYKDEVRRLSRKLGLSSWNKPNLACLASRIPYGVRITPALLKKIDKAENYLAGLGIKQLRLRDYGRLCRIEVEKKDFRLLFNKSKQIVEQLKKLGYNYVTVDLEGYRTGSLNEVLGK